MNIPKSSAYHYLTNGDLYHDSRQPQLPSSAEYIQSVENRKRYPRTSSQPQASVASRARNSEAVKEKNKNRRHQQYAPNKGFDHLTTLPWPPLGTDNNPWISYAVNNETVVGRSCIVVPAGSTQEKKVGIRRRLQRTEFGFVVDEVDKFRCGKRRVQRLIAGIAQLQRRLFRLNMTGSASGQTAWLNENLSLVINHVVKVISDRLLATGRCRGEENFFIQQTWEPIKKKAGHRQQVLPRIVPAVNQP